MTDILAMGEPMLELNQRPPEAPGRVLYLQGHGGDNSNAAIAAAALATTGYGTVAPIPRAAEIAAFLEARRAAR